MDVPPLNLAQQLWRYVPGAIARLDIDLNSVAASQRWIEDCALDGHNAHIELNVGFSRF